MRASGKKRMSTVVVKPDRNTDAYILWDGIREEPYWVGTRARLLARLSEKSSDLSIIEAAERVVALADENGTSLHYPSRTGEYLYGWSEDPLLYRGTHFVRRRDLVELTRRVNNHESINDLGNMLTEVDA